MIYYKRESKQVRGPPLLNIIGVKYLIHFIKIFKNKPVKPQIEHWRFWAGKPHANLPKVLKWHKYRSVNRLKVPCNCINCRSRLDLKTVSSSNISFPCHNRIIEKRYIWTWTRHNSFFILFLFIIISYTGAAATYFHFLRKNYLTVPSEVKKHYNNCFFSVT